MDKKLSKDKEELILRAAQGRFATYGYSKVTMDEIAEDVGMAKASLYYYFPTKDSIFRMVVLHEQEEFLVSTKNNFERCQSASQKLLEYIHLRLRLTESLNNLSPIHQQGWYEVKPIFKELFVPFIQKEITCITQILQEGKKSGEFQIEHLNKTASMILHVVQGLHLRFFRGYDQHSINDPDRTAFKQETLQFVNTILSGIRKNR